MVDEKFIPLLNSSYFYQIAFGLFGSFELIEADSGIVNLFLKFKPNRLPEVIGFCTIFNIPFKSFGDGYLWVKKEAVVEVAEKFYKNYRSSNPSSEILETDRLTRQKFPLRWANNYGLKEEFINVFGKEYDG